MATIRSVSRHTTRHHPHFRQGVNHHRTATQHTRNIRLHRVYPVHPRCLAWVNHPRVAQCNNSPFHRHVSKQRPYPTLYVLLPLRIRSRIVTLTQRCSRFKCSNRIRRRRKNRSSRTPLVSCHPWSPRISSARIKVVAIHGSFVRPPTPYPIHRT